MSCTCKSRTEDDCVCTRLCACGERFEIFEPNDQYCDYCEAIEANEDVFDVTYLNETRVIARATLLDIVLLSISLGPKARIVQGCPDSFTIPLSTGSLWFVRQHPDDFSRNAPWMRDLNMINNTPGITSEMIGLRNENGHLYLNF